MQTPETTAETEVRDVLARWFQAVSAKDVDGITAVYAPDITAYDAILELQFTGVDAYREHWRTCMAFCEGQFVFDPEALHVAAGGDVAFAHFLVRCGQVTDTGGEQLGWMRSTIGLRKVGGAWKITHEHHSAPFDPETSKALLNLEPDAT